MFAAGGAGGFVASDLKLKSNLKKLKKKLMNTDTLIQYYNAAKAESEQQQASCEQLRTRNANLELRARTHDSTVSANQEAVGELRKQVQEAEAKLAEKNKCIAELKSLVERAGLGQPSGSASSAGGSLRAAQSSASASDADVSTLWGEIKRLQSELSTVTAALRAREQDQKPLENRVMLHRSNFEQCQQDLEAMRGVNDERVILLELALKRATTAETSVKQLEQQMAQATMAAKKAAEAAEAAEAAGPGSASKGPTEKPASTAERAAKAAAEREAAQAVLAAKAKAAEEAAAAKAAAKAQAEAEATEKAVAEGLRRGGRKHKVPERLVDVAAPDDKAIRTGGGTLVGTRLTKHFEGHGFFTGTVDGFDEETRYYHVTYDDGDGEHLDGATVLRYMNETGSDQPEQPSTEASAESSGAAAKARGGRGGGAGGEEWCSMWCSICSGPARKLARELCSAKAAEAEAQTERAAAEVARKRAEVSLDTAEAARRTLEERARKAEEQAKALDARQRNSAAALDDALDSVARLEARAEAAEQAASRVEPARAEAEAHATAAAAAEASTAQARASERRCLAERDAAASAQQLCEQQKLRLEKQLKEVAAQAREQQEAVRGLREQLDRQKEAAQRSAQRSEASTTRPPDRREALPGAAPAASSGWEDSAGWGDGDGGEGWDDAEAADGADWGSAGGLPGATDEGGEASAGSEGEGGEARRDGGADSRLRCRNALPPSALDVSRRGSTAQVLRFIEGELSRWVYPPDALRVPDAVSTSGRVPIELSDGAAAALDELAAILTSRGTEWIGEMVQCLATSIVGAGRRSRTGMASHALHRAVMQCHLFGRCCRAISAAAPPSQGPGAATQYSGPSGPSAMNELCRDLARSSFVLEAPLYGALCLAWPEAMHLPAWQPQGKGGKKIDASALGGPGAPVFSVLAVLLERTIVEVQSEGERRALERARDLLLEHGGAGWGGGEAAPAAGAAGAARLERLERSLIEHLVSMVLPTEAEEEEASRWANRGRKAAAAAPAEPTDDAAATVAALELAVSGSNPHRAARAHILAARERPETTPPPPKRQAVRAHPAALEASHGLELVASAKGWKWTSNDLIARLLLPGLASPRGGLETALRLLGRLGQIGQEECDDDALRWLRQQLAEALGQEEAVQFSTAEQAAAASSLIQLLPTAEAAGGEGGEAGGEAHVQARREEAQAALRAITMWRRGHAAGWRAVPAELQDKFHAA